MGSHQAPVLPQQPRQRQSTPPSRELDLTEDSLTRLAGRTTLASLRELQIAVDSTLYSAAIIGDLLHNLKSLDVSGSQLPGGLRDLGTSLGRLVSLTVNNCGLTDLDAIVSYFGALEVLSAADNRLDDLSSLMYHEALRVLDLSGNAVADDDTVATLGSCAFLRELRLVGNPIASRGRFRALVSQAIPQLMLLDGEAIGEQAASPTAVTAARGSGGDGGVDIYAAHREVARGSSGVGTGSISHTTTSVATPSPAPPASVSHSSGGATCRRSLAAVGASLLSAVGGGGGGSGRNAVAGGINPIGGSSASLSTTTARSGVAYSAGSNSASVNTAGGVSSPNQTNGRPASSSSTWASSASMLSSLHSEPSTNSPTGALGGNSELLFRPYSGESGGGGGGTTRQPEWEEVEEEEEQLNPAHGGAARGAAGGGAGLTLLPRAPHAASSAASMQRHGGMVGGDGSFGESDDDPIANSIISVLNEGRRVEAEQQRSAQERARARLLLLLLQQQHVLTRPPATAASSSRRQAGVAAPEQTAAVREAAAAAPASGQSSTTARLVSRVEADDITVAGPATLHCDATAPPPPPPPPTVVATHASEMNDAELVTMLRLRPRDVPQCASRSAFRKFFASYDMQHLRGLLEESYRDMQVPERDEKVAKRLALLQ